MRRLHVHLEVGALVLEVLVLRRRGRSLCSWSEFHRTCDGIAVYAKAAGKDVMSTSCGSRLIAARDPTRKLGGLEVEVA